MALMARIVLKGHGPARRDRSQEVDTFEIVVEGPKMKDSSGANAIQNIELRGDQACC